MNPARCESQNLSARPSFPRPLLALLGVGLLSLAAIGCDNIAIADHTDTPSHSYSSVNGGVRVGVESEVRDVESVNGSIVIESGAHVADVGVVNGSVSIEDDVEMQGLSSVNGSVTIGRNARVSRSLSSVNGSLTVDQGSQVGGKVATVNGTISLRAVAVTDDVETNNGNILLSDGTTVDGDVRIKKSKWSWGGKRRQPKVVIGPNVVVRGVIDAEQPVQLWVHDSASVGEIRGATAQRYSGDTPPA